MNVQTALEIFSHLVSLKPDFVSVNKFLQKNDEF